MKNSYFYYKELTAAEVGKTGTHEIYVRLPNNFDYISFFHNSAVINGSVQEVNFSATDITNGGNTIIPLRFVYFYNSNKEKRIPSLATLFREHNIQEGDIVSIESRCDESGNSYYIRFYKKGEIQISPSSIYFSQNEVETNLKHEELTGDLPLQQIFYGAPGTGKSNTIKNEVDNKNKICFRTTFHPDSDYSTFVGAYKPSMKQADRIYSVEELVIKLKEIKNTGVTYPCHKFSTQYWRSLKDLSTDSIRHILLACGFTESMTTEVAKGIAIGQEFLNKDEDGKIVYAFVPQAFTKAYCQAWNTVEDVFLIIEEINRGNCAQIFGDLFQLLDRKDGVSEYPIYADADLASHISKALAYSPRTDIPAEVKEGTLLMLPKNLYIWATMNTSDQSLFPIDSAFKRRWEWKYIPINTEKENWTIKTNEGLYSWSSFLNKINFEIGDTTSSEDKKLGFYFCKAQNDIISTEKFVSKVLFYIYNDVFKDYGFESKEFFKKDGKVMTFQDFYNLDGTINDANVVVFLKNLNVDLVNSVEQQVEVNAESESITEV